jgi:hypothetical protein
VLRGGGGDLRYAENYTGHYSPAENTSGSDISSIPYYTDPGNSSLIPVPILLRPFGNLVKRLTCEDIQNRVL